MFKLYDQVKIKKDGRMAHIIEMDDDGGTKPTIYLLEIDKKPKDSKPSDVIIWVEENEIE